MTLFHLAGDPVTAFRQVQRSSKIGDLRQRKGQTQLRIPAWIMLRDSNAIFKRLDDHILLQGDTALINKADHRRVEVVLDCEHKVTVNRVALRLKRLAVKWVNLL